MRKLIQLLAAGALALSVTACSGKKAADEISETVNGFFETLEAGDYENAETYLSGSAKESFAAVIQQAKNVEQLFDGISLNQEDKNKLSGLMKNMIGASFKNHQVKEAEKGEDNTYTVNVTVDVMETIDVKEMLNSADINTLLPDEAFDKAAEINESDGQEAATAYLIGLILDQIKVLYQQKIDSASYTSSSRTLTCEKIEGSWKITGIN